MHPLSFLTCTTLLIMLPWTGRALRRRDQRMYILRSAQKKLHPISCDIVVAASLANCNYLALRNEKFIPSVDEIEFRTRDSTGRPL